MILTTVDLPVSRQVTFTLHGIGRVLWAAVMERWGLMYSPEDVFRRRALPPYPSTCAAASRSAAPASTFAGACDDLRIGVTLIFYLQNAAEYLQQREKGNILPGGQPLTLSGLAREGKILFPVEKDKEAVKAERELTKNRNHLIAAARNGDEEAMESLTMEDMDTYSMISQRIVTDDIFSIVDSYFMPYGIECDQYSIMGEILDFMTFKNIITGEEICQLTLDCNDMQFDVCINKNDLLGEPKIGRRFKGIIWLQGQLHY